MILYYIGSFSKRGEKSQNARLVSIVWIMHIHTQTLKRKTKRKKNEDASRFCTRECAFDRWRKSGHSHTRTWRYFYFVKKKPFVNIFPLNIFFTFGDFSLSNHVLVGFVLKVAGSNRERLLSIIIARNKRRGNQCVTVLCTVRMYTQSLPLISCNKLFVYKKKIQKKTDLSPIHKFKTCKTIQETK